MPRTFGQLTQQAGKQYFIAEPLFAPHKDAFTGQGFARPFGPVKAPLIIAESFCFPAPVIFAPTGAQFTRRQQRVA